MIVVDAPSAEVAWRDLVGKFRVSAKNQESRDQPTKELTHVAVQINDPRQRIVFSRAINPAFAIAEVIWILAGADDVSFLSFWNPRMKKFSDDGIRLCGAYGYRLGSRPNIDAELDRKLRHWTQPQSLDQLKLAYEALTQTPNSRQVVLQIWDARSDMPNPSARSKDVPCNLTSHLMIRDGKLEWLQIMRSNDFIWGFPYNLIQFTTLQEVVAGWLGVELGSYVHLSDSLHVYQRHWRELDSAELTLPDRFPSNVADLRIKSYGEWETIFSRVVSLAYRLTTTSSTETLLSISEEAKSLPPGYFEWIALLNAEALRRRGHTNLAISASEMSGSFLQASWKKWMLRAESQRKKEMAISAV